MSSDLTFLMGKHTAVLPGDLRYARNHMWCRPVADQLGFGFTAYAVRLMRDVYFLDWIVAAGAAVELKQRIGHIETSKAESDLYAPLPGILTRFNDDLLQDPTPINTDTYGAGWLFEMAADPSGTMTAAEYHDFLTANWENTQRLLKGRM
jgi:glycine cleavage system H protein